MGDMTPPSKETESAFTISHHWHSIQWWILCYIDYLWYQSGLQPLKIISVGGDGRKYFLRVTAEYQLAASLLCMAVIPNFEASYI